MSNGNIEIIKFDIDETSDIPIWVQLRNRLAYLIDSGAFKPGEKLPTVRFLASELAINYNTVNKAYLNLKTDGLIKSVRGSGVFVSDLDFMFNESYSLEAQEVIYDAINACKELGLSNDDIKFIFNRLIKKVTKSE